LKKTMIITIGNTKGGVGKSTIATNLAVEAARRKKKVALIDADLQGSSSGFRNVRMDEAQKDDIKAFSITTPTLHKDLPSMTGFDLILVDAGGRDSRVFRSAVGAADLLIIPVNPGVFDLWATEDTVNLLRELRDTKDIKARILANQVIQHTIIARETLAALEEFSQDVPLFETRLSQRSVYRNTVIKGLGVVEMEPKGKAAQEIQSLFAEIEKIMGGK
jgi:chromosome partitioning protein